MTNSTNNVLKLKVMNAVRDYGVQLTMFRNAMAESVGLNLTDMECLRFLFFKTISTPSELARHTGLTSGATTAMLDRLENAGLIQRKPNPDDRRGTLIVPAKLSIEKAASWFQSSREAQEALILSYSERDQEIIADVFNRFAKLWEQQRKELIRDL